jgi:hypothetical protein
MSRERLVIVAALLLGGCVRVFEHSGGALPDAPPTPDAPRPGELRIDRPRDLPSRDGRLLDTMSRDKPKDSKLSKDSKLVDTSLDLKPPVGWQTIASSGQGALYDIWGTGLTNIFAVGYTSSPLVIHFDGTTWTPISLPSFSTTSIGVSAVWGSSASDVFAATYAGVVLHFDGMAWTVANLGTSTLRGVWGSGPANVYAVGYNKTLCHYTTGGWASVVTPAAATTSFFALWGSAFNNIYVVGSGGTILHYDGSSWQTQISSTTWELYAVWGSSSSDVYIAGNKKTLLHHDMNTGWTTVSLPLSLSTNVQLSSIWGTGPHDIYVVGSGGTILHYDGAWSQMVSNTTEDLYGVWGAAGTTDSVVYAVGNNGLILRLQK